MFSDSATFLSNLSGTTSTQADTQTQSCSEEHDKNIQEPEEDKTDSSACDGEIEPSQVRSS